MFSDLKHKLRRRVFGRRFQQQLRDDHKTISLLGNQPYLSDHPSLIAPKFQPTINAYEFSCFSQNGEDGIILHLLSRVGVENHFMVEIGTEDGRQCNSANLILNYGWNACLVEAATHWAEKAKQYFAECEVNDRVQVLNSKATAENIKELLYQAGVPKHIDVLSIDIDSHDYWLWKALDDLVPRIVVIEYNASFGPSRSVTIPYKGEGSADGEQHFPLYHGASITAMKRLGEEKGYILVGGDIKGVNAFFVRSDLAAEAGLEAVEPERAYRPHFWRSQTKTPDEQYQMIAHLPLDEIS